MFNSQLNITLNIYFIHLTCHKSVTTNLKITFHDLSFASFIISNHCTWSYQKGFSQDAAYQYGACLFM